MVHDKPTVFLVEGDWKARQTVAAYVKTAQLEIASYSSAETFLDDYQSGQSGCVVVELDLPGINGMELTHELRSQGQVIPVIIHSSKNGTETVVRAMQYGAYDYLVKPVARGRLLASIKEAMTEDVRRREDDLDSLSPRLRQTLSCLKLGDSEKQIAAKLGLSRYTVHDYIKHIYKHQGVRSRGELLAKCFGESPHRSQSA